MSSVGGLPRPWAELSSDAAALELTRRLPAGAVPLVEAGCRVTPDTVIARGHQDSKVLRLPAGGNFELLKKPGDPVKAGETVAVVEELFGLGLRELVSPEDGIVESINPRRTALVLAGPKQEILALVPGQVTQVGVEGVRIAVRGHRIRGWFGLGEPVAATLWPAGELITEAEVRRRIGPEVHGKIVLADSFVLPSGVLELARYGAAGLICGGIDFGPLWELIAPTGRFPAGRGLPTLVVVEGFGVHRLEASVRSVLAAAEGRTVYMTGPVPGRISFARPPHAEVIVPTAD